MAGTAVEAAADVCVGCPTGAPFQNPTLHWAQSVALRLDAGAGHPRVLDHAIDEIRSAPEAASDLGVIDAVGDEAKHTALDRSQGFVVNHVVVSSARASP